MARKIDHLHDANGLSLLKLEAFEPLRRDLFRLPSRHFLSEDARATFRVQAIGLRYVEKALKLVC